MIDKISVALIGAGSMGGALLRGWIGAGVIDGAASAMFDPAPPDNIRDTARAAGVAINPPIDARRYDALVIAVKPQAAAENLAAYAALAADAHAPTPAGRDAEVRKHLDAQPEAVAYGNQVALGEFVLGYRNEYGQLLEGAPFSERDIADIRQAFAIYAEKMPSMLTHFTHAPLVESLERGTLDPKTRELVLLGMLAGMQCGPGIVFHIQGAINAGATEAEVMEVIFLSCYEASKVQTATLKLYATGNGKAP